MNDLAHAIPADDAPPAARFCPACGTALSGLPPACAPCSSGPAKAAPARNILAELGALRTALALYFSSLTVIGLAAVIETLAGPLAPAVALRYESVVSVIFSCLVLAFAVANQRVLRPVISSTGALRWYLIAPLAALASYAMATLIVGGVQHLLGVEGPNFSAFCVNAGSNVWYAVVLVCLQPAVFEEIAFRGIINPSLGRVLGPRETIVVGALLFAILHLSPVAFPHLLVMGLALGYIRNKSGSILPCMVLHFCHNGLCVLAENFPGVFP